MTEDKLQFECVTWFHNTHNAERGYLFEINNKTNKGSHRKGLGLVKGASDLFYIMPDSLPLAIELKTHGKSWRIQHIQDQVHFIRKMQNRDGNGAFVFTKEQFDTLIYHVMNHTGELNSYCDTLNKYVVDRLQKAIEKEQKTVTL